MVETKVVRVVDVVLQVQRAVVGRWSEGNSAKR